MFVTLRGRYESSSLSSWSRGTPFGRALLHGYELPPSFPPQTLPIVFYERDILGRMMMMMMMSLPYIKSKDKIAD